MEKFRKFIHDRHDVTCNQKYGDGLPYSFHLKCVEAQGEKFIHLIRENYESILTDRDIVRAALISHDGIEDGRLTYNDIKNQSLRFLGSGGVAIADIVYCVTDEKGKNRAERKNEKYYKELKENKFAIFVKLADIAANTLYSKLTNSSMYKQYKDEFPKLKEKVYTEEYKEFFNYIENL